jgi:hypothetical protein
VSWKNSEGSVCVIINTMLCKVSGVSEGNKKKKFSIKLAKNKKNVIRSRVLRWEAKREV